MNPWHLLLTAACSCLTFALPANAQTSPAPVRLLGGGGVLIGPSQIVRFDDGDVIVHDRAGTELYRNDYYGWWDSIAPGETEGVAFDFDPVLGRWILAATTPGEGMVIRLSHTENFLGKYTEFHFSESAVQGDEASDLQYARYNPMILGFGGGVVAVSVLLDDREGRTSDFAEDDSGFAIVALSDIEGGTGNTPLTARQTVVSHENFPYDEGRPVPARTLSSASGLYFLSLEEVDEAQYGLSKLAFSGNNFSFSKNFSNFHAESLASDTGRVLAAQPNTTHRLGHADEGGFSTYHLGDPLTPDKRQIRDVVMRNGFLWAVHEGKDDDAEVVRTHWLSISMNTSPRFIAQSGRIGGTNNMSCLAPSIAVNANNDVLVGFTATGAHDFPSASYAMRFAGDAPGTMRGIRHFRTGTAFFDNNIYYFGDASPWPGFSQTRADPGDGTALWTSQYYSDGWPDSHIAQVTGNVPPAITQHPQNRTVAPNTNTSLSITATGTNLQYLWFHEDEPTTATGPTITLTGVNALRVGYYKCRVTNAGGTVWSNAGLVKLTTGNPGVFAFTDIAGNPLSSVNWNEPSENILTLRYRTLTVRRSNGTDGRVRVAVNVRGRFAAPPAFTATEGWDFTGIVTPSPNSIYFNGPGALVFEQGETQKTVTVWLRRDTLVEPSVETMEATMAVDPNLGAVTTTPQLDISLLDNDTAPTFAAAVDYNIPYTNTGNRWKPQRTVTSDGVDAVQTDITPPGGDPAEFSATFSETGTLIFRWRADGDEADKLSVVRDPGIGFPATVGAIGPGSDWLTQAVSINGSLGNTGITWRFQRAAGSQDVFAAGFVDEIRFHQGTGGVVEFEKAAYSVDEGAGTVAVTIRRVGYTSTAGTIGVTLQNGTATGGSDFQPLGLGLLSFAAGQTSRTINFSIYPDQLTEPVETFRAVLSEQSSGIIGIGPVDTATISIADQPGETYDTWAATKFTAAQLANPAIAGKEADPDNDALTNVLEYAMDGNPLSAASAPLPQSVFEKLPGEEIIRHNLAFPRRKQALDLTYKVQRATDLTAWQDGATLTPTGVSSTPAIIQLVSAIGGPVEIRTVRDGVPLNDGRRAWLRVVVICQ